MKGSAIVKKYLKKHVQSLQELLKKTNKRMTADHIHELRVDIKKIRAVLTLINRNAKGFKRRASQKPFDKVFKQAGIVRELQLEEESMRKLKLSRILSLYDKNGKGTLRAEKEKLLRLIDKKHRAKLDNGYRRAIQYCKEIDKKTLRDFVNSEKRKIDKIKHDKHIDAEGLHTLRKKLKEMQYINRMISDGKSENGNEKLQELLGSWHDKVIVERQLKRMIESLSLPAKEMKRVQLAHHKIGTEAKRLYLDIINSSAFVSL